VSQLSSGASHVCAITDNGQLYCWGNNWEGQLGVGDVFEDDEARNDERREPTLVDEGPWISISAGEGHTCGVKSDGTLSCWGRNAEQQSGNHGEAQLNSPTLVNTEHSWKQAAAGQSHSCGLRTDGSLWCWGSNTAQDAGYPLGLETEWQLTEPTPVGDGRWNSLATTGFHTCAVAENSDLWCWGRNDAGQLGTGDTDLRRTPTMIRSNTRDAVTGRFHSCVVTTEQDDVLCTGSNELGQLALLSDEHRSTFTSLREELERYISVQGAL
jgi:alpha-tubulin suppressor-like RCC1 family protein